MASKDRPYLKDPRQFAYWKKSPSQTGKGSEIMNYASPLAHELWYYLRAMGHVTHPPGWKCEHHGEDGFVLHVVRRGALWHEIDGRRSVARSGQACLLDLSQTSLYGVEGNTSLELYWAWINGRDMPRVFLELGADQEPLFPLPDLRRAVLLFRELQSISLREPAGYEVELSGLLTLILAQLFASRGDRFRGFSQEKGGRPFSDPIRRAIDYMMRHYDHGVTVKHIASIAKQSLTYFSRRFHREVGMSPIAYLNRYRIERAKKYLVSTNQPVARVARSVGFPNPHYFTRTFTRIVGVTPLAYRRNPKSAR